MNEQMSCGDAVIYCAQHGIAFDSIDDVVEIAQRAIAEDGKDAVFLNHGKGWAKKTKEVKCHAADPNNCRFHRTGKFAKMGGEKLFDVNATGAFTADDIRSFILEQSEGHGHPIEPDDLSVKINPETGKVEITLTADYKSEVERSARLGYIENMMHGFHSITGGKYGKDEDTYDKVFKTVGKNKFFTDFPIPISEDSLSENEKSDSQGENDIPDGDDMSAEKAKQQQQPDGGSEGEGGDGDVGQEMSGSFTKDDHAVMDVIADAIEAAGIKYENPEWDKMDDGTLTLSGANWPNEGNVPTAGMIENALKQAGYANASVDYDGSDDKFTIAPGEKGDYAPVPDDENDGSANAPEGLLDALDNIFKDDDELSFSEDPSFEKNEDGTVTMTANFQNADDTFGSVDLLADKLFGALDDEYDTSKFTYLGGTGFQVNIAKKDVSSPDDDGDDSTDGDGEKTQGSAGEGGKDAGKGDYGYPDKPVSLSHGEQTFVDGLIGKLGMNEWMLEDDGNGGFTAIDTSDGNKKHPLSDVLGQMVDGALSSEFWDGDLSKKQQQMFLDICKKCGIDNVDEMLMECGGSEGDSGKTGEKTQGGSGLSKASVDKIADHISWVASNNEDGDEFSENMQKVADALKAGKLNHLFGGDDSAKTGENNAGSEFAKSSKDAAALVKAAQTYLEDAKTFLADDQEATELCDGISEGLSMLDDEKAKLDAAKQKLASAKTGFAKKHAQKAVDTAQANLNEMHKELQGMLSDLATKVGASMQEAVEKADGDVAAAEKEVGAALGTSTKGDQILHVTQLANNMILGSGGGVEAGSGESVGDLLDDFDQDKSLIGTFSSASKTAKVAQSAFYDAVEAYNIAKAGGTPAEIKAAADKVSKTKVDYLDAIKAFKDTAKDIHAKLKAKAEAKGAGLSDEDYQKQKQVMQQSGAKSMETATHQFEIGDDGHMKVTKKSSEGGSAGGGESSGGFSKNKQAFLDGYGDAAIKNLAKEAGISEPEAKQALEKALSEVDEADVDEDGILTNGSIDHFKLKASQYAKEIKSKKGNGSAYKPDATMPEKAQFVIKSLEDKIAAAKDPAMKATYEKALAMLKAHHGIGDGPTDPNGKGGSGGGNNGPDAGDGKTPPTGGSGGGNAPDVTSTHSFIASKMHGKDAWKKYSVDDIAKSIAAVQAEHPEYFDIQNGYPTMPYAKKFDKAVKAKLDANSGQPAAGGGSGSTDDWKPNGSDIEGMIAHGWKPGKSSVTGADVWEHPESNKSFGIPSGASIAEINKAIAEHEKTKGGSGTAEPKLPGDPTDDWKTSENHLSKLSDIVSKMYSGDKGIHKDLEKTLGAHTGKKYDFSKIGEADLDDVYGSLYAAYKHANGEGSTDKSPSDYVDNALAILKKYEKAPSHPNAGAVKHLKHSIKKHAGEDGSLVQKFKAAHGSDISDDDAVMALQMAASKHIDGISHGTGNTVKIADEPALMKSAKAVHDSKKAVDALTGDHKTWWDANGKQNVEALSEELGVDKTHAYHALAKAFGEVPSEELGYNAQKNSVQADKFEDVIDKAKQYAKTLHAGGSLDGSAPAAGGAGKVASTSGHSDAAINAVYNNIGAGTYFKGKSEQEVKNAIVKALNANPDAADKSSGAVSLMHMISLIDDIKKNLG